jgi:hypothetical protein
MPDWQVVSFSQAAQPYRVGLVRIVAAAHKVDYHPVLGWAVAFRPKPVPFADEPCPPCSRIEAVILFEGRARLLPELMEELDSATPGVYFGYGIATPGDTVDAAVIQLARNAYSAHEARCREAGHEPTP